MPIKKDIEAKLDAVQAEVIDVDTTVPETPSEVTVGDMIVSDPDIMRPRVLPLIVKPKDGKWKNKQQEEYAKIVNAYAYKNPEKWKMVVATDGKFANMSKKDILLARLAEIGANPRMFNVYSPQGDGAKYTNKLAPELPE